MLKGQAVSERLGFLVYQVGMRGLLARLNRSYDYCAQPPGSMMVRDMVSHAAVPCPLDLLRQDLVPFLGWACRGLHFARLLGAVYQEPPPAASCWSELEAGNLQD